MPATGRSNASGFDKVLLGACAWIAVTPIFLVSQLLAARRWAKPRYSWSRNNISDLGNVNCGPWGEDGRYVCSPLHAVANSGFAVTGVLIVIGVVGLWRSAYRSNVVAGALVLLAGLGYLAAGLAPADQHENIHVVLGAVPIFFAGNLGLLLPALGNRSRSLASRASAALLGVIGLAGTVLFLLGRYLGLGMGGMERIAAFPLPIFLSVSGLAAVIGRRWE